MAISRHKAGHAAMSAVRSEADIGELKFRSRGFYVRLPLRTGRRRRTRLRSGVDPKQSLALPDEAKHLSMTTLRDKLIKIGTDVSSTGATKRATPPQAILL